jgi:hypothetical protein
MRISKNKIIIAVLTVLFFGLLIKISLFPHPRIVSQYYNQIFNPEIAQEFFGRLNGSPVFFRIATDKPFDLSASILVPDNIDVRQDVVEIWKVLDEKQDKSFVNIVDGKNYTWGKNYDKYSGYSLWQGPQIKQTLPAGLYELKVTNLGNSGKFILVVGDQKEFSPKEIIKSIIILPSLKNFFNRSPWLIFFNLTGLFLLVFFIILTILVYLVMRITRKESVNK